MEFIKIKISITMPMQNKKMSTTKNKKVGVTPFTISKNIKKQGMLKILN